MRYTLFEVPGIGEPTGAPGMLTNITKDLPRGTFEVQKFVYRNQYGPVGGGGTTSYGENLDDAVNKLAQAIRAAAFPAILLGYSAGAQVVSMLLMRMARGEFKDVLVVGAVLVANPMRAERDSPPKGWGVAGQHGAFPRDLFVLDIANPADLICCSEAFSPVRLFADVSRGFSTKEPLGWVAQYSALLAKGAAQAWWNPAVRGRYARAAEAVGRYLDGSAHQRWYIQSGQLTNAANILRTRYR